MAEINATFLRLSFKAITGAIKDTVFDYADIALYAAEYLLKAYPDALKTLQVQTLPASDIELLEAIGVKRGCTNKGGGVDIQKFLRS